MTTIHDRDFVQASPGERQVLGQVNTILERGIGRKRSRLCLIDSNGEQIEIPEAVYRIVCHAVPILVTGDSVSVVPIHKELTTQEAAELLNVSRPYLIRLLDEEKIPYTKTGTHRRIRLSDLMNYKRARDKERRDALDELTALSQEFGLYD
jgi:excisionase family DNA binding protein